MKRALDDVEQQEDEVPTTIMAADFEDSAISDSLAMTACSLPALPILDGESTKLVCQIASTSCSLSPQRPPTIERLPTEVIELILCHLAPYGHLQKASMVCKKWHRIGKSLYYRRKRDFAEGNGSGRLLTAVYDIANEPRPTARYSHSAVYHAGYMYVFGGSNAQSATFNDLWRFDMNARRWQRIIAKGQAPTPRGMSSFVTAPGDKLYLFGGWHPPPPAYVLPGTFSPQYFADLDIFDIRTESWMRVPVEFRPPGMCGHSCVYVDISGGLLVVFGGALGNRRFSNAVHTFSVQQQTWEDPELRMPGQSLTLQKPAGRAAHQCTLLDDHLHMIIYGGSNLTENHFTDCWMLEMSATEPWHWTKLDIFEPHLAPPLPWVIPGCRINSMFVFLAKMSDEIFSEYALYWSDRSLPEAPKRNSMVTSTLPGPSSLRRFASYERQEKRLEQLEKVATRLREHHKGVAIPDSVVEARFCAFPHFMDVSTAVTQRSVRFLTPCFSIPPSQAPDQALFATFIATPFEGIIFGGLENDSIIVSSENPMDRHPCRKIVNLYAPPMNVGSPPSF